ncbi:hypothetical protein Cassandra_0301 [Pseudomonas phage Cassandra]|nr:hypothetical protein Cassandra_0301 [Pseudomonas phage Cassandra]WPK40010.1 hypothetical protein ETTORE_0301 [Pseudomonas phage Ettore]
MLLRPVTCSVSGQIMLVSTTERYILPKELLFV